MDRFAALSTFVAVAEKRGFAAAARRLNQSPTAVTRTVSALEQYLGVRLFNRTTRAVSLTDAGQRLLERSRQLLLELEEVEQEARSDASTPRGQLVVSAPLVFGRMFVSPLVCEYKIKHPGVGVVLNLSDRITNLVEDGVDGAFRIGSLPDATLMSKRLGLVRRVAIASPAYLRENGEPESPQDLAGHKLIQFSALSNSHAWRFFHGGKAKDIHLNPDYATNSADAAIHHAAQDGGVALALSYQVAELVRQKALKILLPKFEPAPYPIQFVYPSARHLPAKTRALINLVASTRKWDFTEV